MRATQPTTEKASSYGLAERDVRALTQYLTVLEDVGRVRGADDLYLVVSQSGREYLVDAEQGACECDDYRYRGGACKHVRRVTFATGERAIPTGAAIDLDVDPSIGEHVEGELRYVAADGGDPEEVPIEEVPASEATREEADRGESDERNRDADPGSEAASDRTDARPSSEGSWVVRDRDRDKVREFDTRAAAESAISDLGNLGLDVELLEPDAERTGPGAEEDDGEQAELPAPGGIDPDAYDLDERTIGDDPLTWLPEAFVDWIDGTPAINRKGFEVLGHFYDVDVETGVQVGPADTDFEYAQVKATATTPDGRRCEALASAHVDRGDDRDYLLEMADTRARKRALSIATGVGIVAVEELENEAGRA